LCCFRSRPWSTIPHGGPSIRKYLLPS
jgi:hypothetical protein